MINTITVYRSVHLSRHHWPHNLPNKIGSLRTGALLVTLGTVGLLEHPGFSIYAPFGIPIQGFNWEFLYAYLIAWPAALAVSFQPIFRRSDGEPAQPNVDCTD